MLLTLTTTHQPATDLGWLLHKRPDRFQQFELAQGVAHVFFPEAGEEKCTAALLLDMDPVELARAGKNLATDAFALSRYVNDRPYVASSFLSAAIAKAFSSALNGRCKDKPELISVRMPLVIQVAALPAPRGGEGLIRDLFEPLSYEVQVHRQPLEPLFPEWGESKYFNVELKGLHTVQDALSHLYVLIPTLDADKHYWVNEDEVAKLIDKGEGWLATHPQKELVARRYLRNRSGLARRALNALLTADEMARDEDEPAEKDTAKERLHDLRLKEVRDQLRTSGARRVIDLGCGEGKLLRLLMKEKQFEHILGMDVAWRDLEIAGRRLQLDELPIHQKGRIALIQGSLTYRDRRLEGFDAAAVVEVIEHLDPSRLAAFERVLFECARPGTVVLTTPNAEYNVKYETLSAGAFRHSDHRFEWTRAEFETWARRVADTNHYTVTFFPLGEVDEIVGGPSQMAVFTRGN